MIRPSFARIDTMDRDKAREQFDALTRKFPERDDYCLMFADSPPEALLFLSLAMKRFAEAVANATVKITDLPGGVTDRTVIIPSLLAYNPRMKRSDYLFRSQLYEWWYMIWGKKLIRYIQGSGCAPDARSQAVETIVSRWQTDFMRWSEYKPKVIVQNGLTGTWGSVRHVMRRSIPSFPDASYGSEKPDKQVLEFLDGVHLVYSIFNFVVAVDFPVAIQGLERTGDKSYRMSSAGTPVLEYRDGYKIYALNGIIVPNKIMEMKRVTARSIIGQRNAEIRRVLIERMGWEKFLEDARAIRISEDKYGTLYEIPGMIDNNERPYRVVRVKNGTPEKKDGSYKEYFIRVDPTSRTAQEGVARTFREFRNTPQRYEPYIET